MLKANLVLLVILVIPKPYMIRPSAGGRATWTFTTRAAPPPSRPPPPSTPALAPSPHPRY